MPKLPEVQLSGFAVRFSLDGTLACGPFRQLDASTLLVALGPLGSSRVDDFIAHSVEEIDCKHKLAFCGAEACQRAVSAAIELGFDAVAGLSWARRVGAVDFWATLTLDRDVDGSVSGRTSATDLERLIGDLGTLADLMEERDCRWCEAIRLAADRVCSAMASRAIDIFGDETITLALGSIHSHKVCCEFRDPSAKITLTAASTSLRIAAAPTMQPTRVSF